MARGNKTGGRTKGTPNKATLVQQMVTEALETPAGREAVAQALQKLTAPPSGQKKAVEVLREMMMLSGSLVALHQPKRDAAGNVTVENHEKLQAYLNIASRTAADLARFESPTFKAVAVQEVPPMPQAQGAEGGNVASSIRKRTQKDAMAVYMRVVRGAKAG
ncbi:MAG: hypothetical protein KGL39_30760 [Patescibacteria group bacterium]|nr:hypothetical protein [Patescibacteria group bacterium]